jgi:hypothetical protein
VEGNRLIHLCGVPSERNEPCGGLGGKYRIRHHTSHAIAGFAIPSDQGAHHSAGPQDTIDPDFAGVRSSLAALGIGYIGYSNNNFFDNMLPAERTTFNNHWSVLCRRNVVT